MVDNESYVDRSISLWQHVTYCKSRYKNDLYMGHPNPLHKKSSDSSVLTKQQSGGESSSSTTTATTTATTATTPTPIRRIASHKKLRPVLRPDASPSSLSVWRELFTHGSPLRPPIPPREEMLTRVNSTYRSRIESLMDLLASKGLAKEAEAVLNSIPLQDP
jgi:hypothetical protein